MSPPPLRRNRRKYPQHERKKNLNEQIIWESTLDNRYAIQVVRVAPYEGKLVIREADEEIFSQQVPLSYGATFGPDVSDIANWQEIALGFIENQKR
jgi:hypothetical protein